MIQGGDLTGFIPFSTKTFPGLFQNLSRTQNDFSRTLKFTILPFHSQDQVITLILLTVCHTHHIILLNELKELRHSLRNLKSLAFSFQIRRLQSGLIFSILVPL